MAGIGEPRTEVLYPKPGIEPQDFLRGAARRLELADLGERGGMQRPQRDVARLASELRFGQRDGFAVAADDVIGLHEVGGAGRGEVGLYAARRLERRQALLELARV